MGKDFKYRILVAEDETDLRLLLEAVFMRVGYEVRSAADGFEALALMSKTLPDLIVSDLDMPRMSGFEFLSVVRRRFAHIPVIVISGSFDTGQPVTLLTDAFFRKGDADIEQILKTVQDLLEHPPDRPYPLKMSTAPVWMHRNGRYVVLTCPNCLRSSSVMTDPLQAGVQQVDCIHCGAEIQFVVEPRGREETDVA